MDQRLLPLNGVIALLRDEPGWSSALADQGFRLHLVEADVQSTPALVRADVISYRRNPDLIVLCECKSGLNITPRQARSYLAAEFAGLRQRGTQPDLAPGTPITAVFAGLDENRDALLESMEREGIEAPLLTIGSGRAVLAGASVPGLEDFAVEDPKWGLPPIRFAIDHESPTQEVKELLVPVIGAAQSRGEDFLDLASVAAGLLPDWAALGTQARRGFIDKLKAAGRELERDGMRGDIQVQSANNIEPRIVILRKLAKRDPRGAPVAWQAQGRRAGRALGRGKAEPGEEKKQMSFDELDRESSGPE